MRKGLKKGQVHLSAEASLYILARLPCLFGIVKKYTFVSLSSSTKGGGAILLMVVATIGKKRAIQQIVYQHMVTASTTKTDPGTTVLV